jgi:hypothetical protein
LAASLPLLTAGRVRAQTPNIYLNPTPLELIKIGDGGMVEVVLADVSAAAGFEFTLSFDKNIVRVEAVDLMTPPAGVNLIPLKSINNENGEVKFGTVALCDSGVCPNLLSGSPAVLARLTVAAVGEGVSSLTFDTPYTLFGTEMGTDDWPVRLESTLTNGLIRVGEAGPTINLSVGGNTVTWPVGLGGFTSLSALESIAEDCGGVAEMSRRKSDWWESAVPGYGGVGFALSEGKVIYVRVGSDCVWSP